MSDNPQSSISLSYGNIAAGVFTGLFLLTPWVWYFIEGATYPSRFTHFLGLLYCLEIIPGLVSIIWLNNKYLSYFKQNYPRFLRWKINLLLFFILLLLPNILLRLQNFREMQGLHY